MDAVADKAASGADTLAARVEAAQQELQAGIDRAGLRDDPFRHPLQALSTTMGLFPAFAAEIRSAIDHARQPIDPAAVERLEQAAATGAATQAGSLARAHSLRSVLIGATILVGAVLIAAAGGFWWGRSSAVAAVASTDAGVTAAFRDGPTAAATWLNLMRSNDPAAMLGPCTGKGVVAVDGRRGCVVGIWIDPVRNAAPALVSTGR